MWEHETLQNRSVTLSVTSCDFIVFDVQHLSLFSLSTFFFLLFFLLFCFRNQMGNLLKVLTCTELDQGPNFFLDFESEQSFCLAWCPSLFPATNILQVPLSELSLQICLTQRNSKTEFGNAFAYANALCK